MQIPAEEIQTKEVLNWQGIHLLHFPMSSCSQKVRILLGEKQITWASHPIDLAKHQQKTDWYLGINSAGVVPVLIHDGRVYNESNDILIYLDDHFPTEAGSYLPASHSERQQAEALMGLEEELHQHLRVVTFTFVMPGRLMNYNFNREEVDTSVRHFDDILRQLNDRLASSRYLCGDRIMLPDIAWFITVHRLVLAGYPIAQLPALSTYYEALHKRPAFYREANAGALAPKIIGHVFRAFLRLSRSSLGYRLSA